MMQIKSHISDLYRAKNAGISRKGMLRLDMNEAFAALPDDFVASVFSMIDSDYLSMYPECEALQEKVALHNGLKSENICLSNGSDAAIKYIFDAFVSQGDRVLLTEPTFAMYPVYCKMFGASVTIVEYEMDLSFTVEKFLKAITGDIKLAVLVNPNNPTGTLTPANDIVRIIKKARDCGVIAIVDEAYFHFCNETVIDKISEYENLIVLRTFSKLCAMAALRLGYAAAAAGIIEGLTKVKPTFDVNGVAVLFAERFLDTPGLMDSLLKEFKEGKAFLIDKLSRNSIEFVSGNANFVLIKCPGKAPETVRALSEKNILAGGGFKQNTLKDYIRVTVSKKEVMERFFEEFIGIYKKNN
ncbi:pyridoxal phosphate-dependent aminotransferase [Candidatus Magnetominusculus dajiuhuensis]|uniref:pyridoxal phosphate-dependent aminotransferase n=1 Tax=Candidatus Magnetominusculus dajiuhuensis TaxID=3137712 RepID=UPI003B437D2C